jgi:hypothetical protein
MGTHWKQPQKNPAPSPTPKVYCPPLFGGVLNTHQSGVFSNTSLVQSVSYDTWQAPVRYLKKHKGKTIRAGLYARVKPSAMVFYWNWGLHMA